MVGGDALLEKDGTSKLGFTVRRGCAIFTIRSQEEVVNTTGAFAVGI